MTSLEPHHKIPVVDNVMRSVFDTVGVRPRRDDEPVMHNGQSSFFVKTCNTRHNLGRGADAALLHYLTNFGEKQ